MWKYISPWLLHNRLESLLDYVRGPITGDVPVPDGEDVGEERERKTERDRGGELGELKWPLTLCMHVAAAGVWSAGSIQPAGSCIAAGGTCSQGSQAGGCFECAPPYQSPPCGQTYS